MKKTTRTKKVSRSNEEMLLVLDGRVFLETRKNGKVVKQEDLDGKIVLEGMLHLITQALDYLDSQKTTDIVQSKVPYNPKYRAPKKNETARAR